MEWLIRKNTIKFLWMGNLMFVFIGLYRAIVEGGYHIVGFLLSTLAVCLLTVVLVKGFAK